MMKMAKLGCLSVELKIDSELYKVIMDKIEELEKRVEKLEEFNEKLGD